MDTTGAEESVFFSEVSLFQGLQEWDSIGVRKRCPVLEVSLERGSAAIQYLRLLPVSPPDNCTEFRWNSRPRLAGLCHTFTHQLQERVLHNPQ